ncbi:adenylate/guanylate cyclase domain-containing protein [Desulfobacula sp.]|uniref:adenylate/guanylate cyclase domain-containing protein n=1 Tax=Desulfobacula sp. TaxID=2593537 RepID=UPI0026253B0B|nr:adenylate/guanylate cyclase domain-containing protein [Desulfobacula sp.]
MTIKKTKFESNFIFHDFLYKKREKEKLTLFFYSFVVILFLISCVWISIAILHSVFPLLAINLAILAFLAIILWLLKKGKPTLAGHILSIIILFWIAFILIFIQGNHKIHPISVHHWLLVYIFGIQFVLIGEKKRYVFIHFFIGLCMFIFFELRIIEFEPIITSQKADSFSYLFTPLAILFSLILINCIFVNKLNKVENQFFKSNEQLDILLKNLLPDEIVKKITEEGKTFAEAFSECSVMFVKVVGLEKSYDNDNHGKAISILDDIFSKFDEKTENFQIERIKTIRDLYMVVAGVPKITENHAVIITKIALEFMQIIKNYEGLDLRIGINSGPVVAGLIGKNGLIYDLWGDTVNIASRMESHGVIGKIQISQETKEMIGRRFFLNDRSPIRIKGKGFVKTYFVSGYNPIDKQKI